MKLKWFFVLLFLILIVIFTAQNYEVVEIKFLVWSFQTSRAIIMFSALFIGILIGWISSSLKGNKEEDETV